MTKFAFLCSGTGSQTVGMGRALFETYPAFRQVFEAASDVFGLNLPKLAFEGTAEEIGGTVVSHRLIYTMSVATWEVARTRFPQPEAFAGHSLGEMAALTACGVFSAEQGFTALKWRSQYLEDAAAELDGAMYAILGSNAEAIEAACIQADGFVQPVNYNSPAQTVISGDADAAGRAAELLVAQGAKAMKLGVRVPFHTVRLQGAADRLRESLSTLEYNRKPSGRFFCNLTGAEKTDFTDLPDYLAAQMVSPVRFTDELAAMQGAGITAFVELGPGKVLTGLVKKTLKDAVAVNTDTPPALDKALSALLSV